MRVSATTCILRCAEQVGFPFMIYLFFSLHVFTCVHLYMSAGTHGGQNRLMDPMEPDLQVVVSRLM